MVVNMYNFDGNGRQNRLQKRRRYQRRYTFALCSHGPITKCIRAEIKGDEKLIWSGLIWVTYNMSVYYRDSPASFSRGSCIQRWLWRYGRVESWARCVQSLDLVSRAIPPMKQHLSLKFKGQKYCPSRGGTAPSCQTSAIYRERVAKMAFCPNRREGCIWNGSETELENHLNTENLTTGWKDVSM